MMKNTSTVSVTLWISLGVLGATSALGRGPVQPTEQQHPHVVPQNPPEEITKRPKAVEQPTAVPLPGVSLPTRNDQRDSLYKAIRASFEDYRIKHSRPCKLSGQYFLPTYDALPRPKSFAVCINWQKSLPTTYVGQGMNFTGCHGTSVGHARDWPVNRCKERGLEQKYGCKCVLVDYNGRNMLELAEGWPRQ